MVGKVGTTGRTRPAARAESGGRGQPKAIRGSSLALPLLVPLASPADNTRMQDFSAVRRDSLVRYLRRHLAGEVRFDDTSRRLYATDASHYQIMPLGVVVPRKPDDLTATVQIAAELGVP